MSNREISHLVACEKETIWGGQKLVTVKKSSLSRIGETWEVSRLESGPSLLAGEKRSLDQVYTDKELPYLAKFIDTNDNLSVQVHPGDDYARRVENSSGKTECWFVLEAEEGAGIYLGFKEGFDPEEFKDSVLNGEDLTKFLVFYPVKRGNFFYIPSGSVHAIGKGVTLAEVQQSSGITYRVWDWNRVDQNGVSRELHIEKAMDVLNFDPVDNSPEAFRFIENAFASESSLIIQHRDFIVYTFSNSSDTENLTISLPSVNQGRVRSLMVFSGEVEGVQEYFSALISDHAEKVTLLPKSELLVIV